MGKIGIIREFMQYLFKSKKWWLATVVIMLLLLGALIILTQGSAIAPFIYTLF
ncbi:MAG: DUF5989 family protein [Candidatus Krumholzibacteriia bacterium]|jgi:hypothetical protein